MTLIFFDMANLMTNEKTVRNRPRKSPRLESIGARTSQIEGKMIECGMNEAALGSCHSLNFGD